MPPLITIVVLAVLLIGVTAGALYLRSELKREREDAESFAIHATRNLETATANTKALMERISQLETQVRQVPGVTPGEKDWHVMVNGERVPIRPLTGEQWLATMQELPEFVYAYAQDRVAGKNLGKKDFEGVHSLAKKWIGACADGEVNLDKLTLPEAEHAVTHISELNGITQQLREFFRERLTTMAGGRPDGPALRGQAKRPPRNPSN